MQELPIDPKPVKTTSGTTFESVQTELNDIASTIQKASQDKLDKANAQVTKAEAILGKAEAALRHAKLAVRLSHSYPCARYGLVLTEA